VENGAGSSRNQRRSALVRRAESREARAVSSIQSYGMVPDSELAVKDAKKRQVHEDDLSLRDRKSASSSAFSLAMTFALYKAAIAHPRGDR